MFSDESPRLVPTITSCYQPVEGYLRFLQQAGAPQAEVLLRPLDSFLLRQYVAYCSARPTVIDLAAEATLGASTVMWLSYADVTYTVTPLPRWQPSTFKWRSLLLELQNELTIVTSGLQDSPVLDLKESSDSLHHQSYSPRLYCLAQKVDAIPALSEVLNVLLRWHSQASVMFFPLGLIGESRLLEEALSFCMKHPSYRLTALRELSPFFASSQLGLIYPVQEEEVGKILQRLRQLYEGNFEFLSLVNHSTTLARENARLLRQQEEAAPLLKEHEVMKRSKGWRLSVAYWRWRDHLRSWFSRSR